MKAHNFLLLVGFFLAFGGVGGVENSITDWEFLGAAAIAFLGLMVAWCGVMMMKIEELG